MKSAFLDANVLFSAAYSESSSLLRLWKLRGVRLCSSAYAMDEAQRNLDGEAALKRLQRLVGTITTVPEADPQFVPPSVKLPSKDIPILAAAIAAKASYLVTGDKQDFGALFGKTVAGVTVLLPRDFVALMESTAKQ